MAIFREGTNPIWAAFVSVAFLGSLLVDFYWLFTESGPIGWLAEVEASILGGQWFPTITFTILLLGELGVLLGLKVILELLTGARLTTPRR